MPNLATVEIKAFVPAPPGSGGGQCRRRPARAAQQQ